MERPKGKSKSPKRKRQKPTKELIRVQKTDIVNHSGRDWISRRFIWSDIPSDLIVSSVTPVGSRLVIAPHPDIRFTLQQYHLPDEKFPHGGVAVKESGGEYLRYFPIDAVALYIDTSKETPIPDEFKFFTGGHREGTKAAENAARQEMKRRIREKKLQDKEEKKRLKQQAKEEKLFRKKIARRNKSK